MGWGRGKGIAPRGAIRPQAGKEGVEEEEAKGSKGFSVRGRWMPKGVVIGRERGRQAGKQEGRPQDD